MDMQQGGSRVVSNLGILIGQRNVGGGFHEMDTVRGVYVCVLCISTQDILFHEETSCISDGLLKLAAPGRLMRGCD